MNNARLLQVMVVADIMLSFASVGAEGFFGWTLPPELRAFTHHRFGHLAGPGNALRVMLLLITASAAFVSWIGLLGFWRHARGVYVFALAAGLLLTLYSGPSVRPSISMVFLELNALVGGVILGLIYFTDLARRFERPSPRTAAPPVNAGVRA